MIELIWDAPFLRMLKKWKKKHPNLVTRFEERLLLFTEDPYHPSLKTHHLSNNLKEFWAFSINYEHRVVFQFIDDTTVLLIAIGLHDQVY